MASIASQTATRDGVAPAAQTAGAADLTLDANDGLALVEVSNPTGGDLTVTFAPTATVNGLSLSGSAKTVPAGATRWFGPFPPSLFNAEDGSVAVDADAGLLLRAIRI